jgi:Mce-associated membrane protein
MEGDAGTSQLNPTDADDSLRTEVTTEDSSESETGADQTGEAVTTEDSSESETGADPTDTEDSADAEAAPVERGPSRLSRGWLAGIAMLLVVLAGAIGAGGYFALRFHQESQVIARDDAAAVNAAIECVTATQAPDTSAMLASEQKIVDCGTGAYRTQAMLYTSMLVQAYQASNVHVQVSDARAAVERNNDDGSVDVLVAMRVKVSGDQAQNETGYRLRVKMAKAEGSYRIAKLDQVTK